MRIETITGKQTHPVSGHLAQFFVFTRPRNGGGSKSLNFYRTNSGAAEGLRAVGSGRYCDAFPGTKFEGRWLSQNFDVEEGSILEISAGRTVLEPIKREVKTGAIIRIRAGAALRRISMGLGTLQTNEIDSLGITGRFDILPITEYDSVLAGDKFLSAKKRSHTGSRFRAILRDSVLDGELTPPPMSVERTVQIGEKSVTIKQNSRRRVVNLG